MTVYNVVIFVYLVHGIVVSRATHNSPVVNLGDNASLRGFVVHTHDSTKPVYAFTGVPFAETPVRFLPAEPLKLWDGEKDATKQGNICIQSLETWKYFDPTYDTSKLTLSEDCLLLNIWTPSLVVEPKLDVMVWFHGGGLTVGAGSGYEGTALATFHDVVVVSINYRLAGLGFLSTGDSNAPGNVGMLDQIEALRWVQKYIHKFGGDPEKVTIFGESAGAWSVSFHMVSPLSRHLFKRAISQSGVSALLAPHPAETSPSGITKTREVAKREGCPTEDHKSMVECLRGKPAESFISKTDTFMVMVDGHFLTDSPYNLYATGQINAKDYMLGFNAFEGHIIIPFLPAIAEGLNKSIDVSNLTAEDVREAFQLLAFEDYAGNSEIIDVLMEKYIGGTSQHGDLTKALVDLYGDFYMNHRILDVARKHSVKDTTFVYYFNHRLGIVDSIRPEWVTADHADDIVPSFGFPFFQSTTKLPLPGHGNNHTDEDRKISKLMMSYWTNFAKTGNPNGEGLPHWPKYDCKTKKYMELSSSPHVAADYKPELMKLWTEEIPKLDTTKTYKGFPWKCPGDEKEEL